MAGKQTESHEEGKASKVTDIKHGRSTESLATPSIIIARHGVAPRKGNCIATESETGGEVGCRPVSYLPLASGQVGCNGPPRIVL